MWDGFWWVAVWRSFLHIMPPMHMQSRITAEPVLAPNPTQLWMSKSSMLPNVWLRRDQCVVRCLLILGTSIKSVLSDGALLMLCFRACGLSQLKCEQCKCDVVKDYKRYHKWHDRRAGKFVGKQPDSRCLQGSGWWHAVGLMPDTLLFFFFFHPAISLRKLPWKGITKW